MASQTPDDSRLVRRTVKAKRKGASPACASKRHRHAREHRPASSRGARQDSRRPASPCREWFRQLMRMAIREGKEVTRSWGSDCRYTVVLIQGLLRIFLYSLDGEEASATLEFRISDKTAFFRLHGDGSPAPLEFPIERESANRRTVDAFLGIIERGSSMNEAVRALT